MAIPVKKTRGRQKVAMVRMVKESNRLVTFSKRRSGLFKKASELCTLTNSEVVIVVFSPGRKAFSFGHPSVDTIVNRYLGVDLSLNHARSRCQSPEEDMGDQQLSDMFTISNKELTLLTRQFEAEKKHNEDLIKSRESEEKDSMSWWLSSIEEHEASTLHLLLRPMIALRQELFEHSLKSRDSNPLVSFLGAHPMDQFQSSYHFPPSYVVGEQSSFVSQSSMQQNLNDYPPMSNPMGLGGSFDANEPQPFGFGGSHQLDHGSPESEPSLTLGLNVKNFTSSMMGSNSMDAANPPPLNSQAVFGFKLGFY